MWIQRRVDNANRALKLSSAYIPEGGSCVLFAVKRTKQVCNVCPTTPPSIEASNRARSKKTILHDSSLPTNALRWQSRDDQAKNPAK